MDKHRQRKIRFVTLVGLSTLLIASSVLSVFFPAPHEADAAVTISKKSITYAGSDAPKPHINKKAYTFGKTPNATTATINEDAGSGNKIEKIVFYKGTQAVKTVSVNAQTYNGTESFTGDTIEVNSSDNGSAGSWFAWTRGITNGWTAGGQGDTWDAYDNIPASTVGTEDITTYDSGKSFHDVYLKAPGKKVKMTVQYPISNNFVGKVDGADLGFPISYVDNRTNIVQEKNPQLPSNGAKVKVDKKSRFL